MYDRPLLNPVVRAGVDITKLDRPGVIAQGSYRTVGMRHAGIPTDNGGGVVLGNGVDPSTQQLQYPWPEAGGGTGQMVPSTAPSNTYAATFNDTMFIQWDVVDTQYGDNDWRPGN